MRGVDRTKAIEASREASRIWEISKAAVEKYGVAGPPGPAASWGTISGTLGDQTDLQSALSGKAASGDLTTHTSAANPHSGSAAASDLTNHTGNTSNPHSVTATQVLPTQTGNNGKFLGTNGTVASWGTVSASGGGILHDLQANRPAAATDGRLFFATDGYFPQVDNGVTWDVYVDGFKCSSPPASGSLSVINGTDIVLTDEGDGLLYQGNGNGSAGNKYNAGVVAIPAEGAYTFTMGFDPTYLLPGEGVGICLTDGTGANAKMLMFHCFNASGSLYLYAQWATAPTTYGGGAGWSVTLPTYLYFRRLYLRIYDDRTTNLTFSYNDKFRLGAYTVAGTLARTAWLTPAYAGAFGMENVTVTNGLIAKQMKIFHWSLG